MTPIIPSWRDIEAQEDQGPTQVHGAEGRRQALRRPGHALAPATWPCACRRWVGFRSGIGGSQKTTEAWTLSENRLLRCLLSLPIYTQ